MALGFLASRWSPLEAALLQATDELHIDDMISEVTWATLAESYGEPELIDVVITVAGHRMVSMALNTLGTHQLEPDREGFPNIRG